jgi:hypothetical protein
MYTSTYNTNKSNQKITAFNRAQMVRAWFADAYPYEFTREEKKHLWWSAKWLVVGFVVASVARYLINQL